MVVQDAEASREESKASAVEQQRLQAKRAKGSTSHPSPSPLLSAVADREGGSRANGCGSEGGSRAKAAAQKTGEPRTCRQHAHVRRTRLSLFGRLSFTLALLPSLSVIDSV